MVRIRSCGLDVRSISGPLTRKSCVRGFTASLHRCISSSSSSSASSDREPEQSRLSFHQVDSSQKELVIFSGIQPTGIPHLGNYLGALRQWKQFQDAKTRATRPLRYQLIFSIVDLHALTHHQSPEELFQSRKATYASLLAIGLDPRHSSIYFQSELPGHAQLMWYLSNFASTGYLSRMTQWKSKLGVSETSTLEDQMAREKLKLGLFSYPVLQAADILLFNTDIVPVGEDQQQHVEFTRNLARSFNSHYNEANGGKHFFTIPQVMLSPAKRVMSLKDPRSKMSKSHEDARSRILITDSPDEIRAKIAGALTDSVTGISYDPQTRPGIANLLEILQHVSEDQDVSCEGIAADHQNVSMRAFKTHVADQVIKCLSGFRDRFNELMDPGNDEMVRAMDTSYRVVSALADSRLKRVEGVMGLGSQRPQSEMTDGAPRFS